MGRHLIHEQASQGPEALGTHFHTSQRITLRTIEARGDNHEIRCELAHDGQEDRVEHFEILRVTKPLAI